ncbi:ATPase/histidine kinase/DNA gyrase B/HSP90 domain protein [Marvinbryantia formatexigens DSM 14469]|uniref:ATPase/histidine kinase/DNA gyrase B/HSP90 domain protein n=1 Tax=Marvinbryantia formatexigens DSM 14469 TaxID=478749 RepID=C6LI86_9FIRM|nr:sensor histidine kinase [Marvinbryantia formatexigens]EET59741.1 ATPase/histidine kinase/DNA gyrase B/HSP90 domain protein [Marvinbryantia formatexigens DSM 14469]UWO26615.1 GHKL domain-containing protein [Marvinbryantia formatexigens DSM 14469]SDG47051.1 GHKL domain-containing protein [Marvinbryantia formatexigens]
MMEWYQIISYLLTNELRLVTGIFCVTWLMGVSLERRVLPLLAAGGCLVTALQVASFPEAGVIGTEILFAAVIIWHYRREQLRLFLFLIFFYEVGVSLWDFLFSAGLGVLFQSRKFMDTAMTEHLAGIWITRLLMAGAAIRLRKRGGGQAELIRPVSAAAVLGLLGAIVLSEQTLLPIDEERTGSWIILSMVLLCAVMFYRLTRQRDMEAEIARLKQEQAEILERDYRALRATYAANAKLYHDLHNHIEAIYQCLKQGEFPEAMQYCEDLRAPVREISQSVWTGDKATDCLISSKMALAEQRKIKTEVNIEFPRNTNIRSVDLTTILGNLLDNALEAADTAADGQRFLALTVRRINEMLIIKVENSYGKEPVQKEGRLQTAKTEKDFHGWGLKSVQTVAERYDGTVSTAYQDGIFKAVVTLSFQPVKIE